MKTNKVFFLILLMSFFLNLYGANWDGGHYLHPDERLYLMAADIRLPKSLNEFLSPASPLNPHMFYYGPLPVYLYKLFFNFINPAGNFLLTSRFLPGIFTILTIIIIFEIGKKAFDEKVGLLSGFLMTFSTGIIQHAHFITTESILNFFLYLILLLCILIIKKKRYHLFIFVGILIALAATSKIVGYTFVFIPLTAYLYLLSRLPDRRKISVYFICSLVLIVLISILLAPYQIIDYQNFLREQIYMQGVVLGTNRAPFTIIYNNTLPYLYPLLRIFPVTFGFLSLPLGFIGLFLLLKKTLSIIIKRWPKIPPRDFIILLIMIYPISYFIWVGSWFAKFSRYYILLIPFLSLMAAYMINRVNKKILILLLFIIAGNGLIFFKNIYFNTNPRMAASSWIYQNIPNSKTIASEYWDDSLPFPSSVSPVYNNRQLDLYDEPDDYLKMSRLVNELYKSDYFITSSRRVYYSILRNKESYPLTAKLYQRLFSGQLGFTMKKKFTNYPFVFSDDWADESFQSYDHPPVMIFINEKRFTPSKLISIIRQ